MSVRAAKGWALRTLPFMMTCEALEEFVVDYVDGALPAPQKRKFDLHLCVCGSCRRYIDHYRKTIALSVAALEPAPGPEADQMPEDLVQAILASRAQSRSGSDD